MRHSQSPKQLLNQGRRLNGCWIETFSPIAAEIMAQSGYDTAMIDLEHGAGSYLDAISMMQAVSSHNCIPLIRAESADAVAYGYRSYVLVRHRPHDLQLLGLRDATAQPVGMRAKCLP